MVSSRFRSTDVAPNMLEAPMSRISKKNDVRFQSTCLINGSPNQIEFSTTFRINTTSILFIIHVPTVASILTPSDGIVQE